VAQITHGYIDKHLKINELDQIVHELQLADNRLAFVYLALNVFAFFVVFDVFCRRFVASVVGFHLRRLVKQLDQIFKDPDDALSLDSCLRAEAFLLQKRNILTYCVRNADDLKGRRQVFLAHRIQEESVRWTELRVKLEVRAGNAPRRAQPHTMSSTYRRKVDPNTGLLANARVVTLIFLQSGEAANGRSHRAFAGAICRPVLDLFGHNRSVDSVWAQIAVCGQISQTDGLVVQHERSYCRIRSFNNPHRIGRWLLQSYGSSRLVEPIGIFEHNQRI